MTDEHNNQIDGEGAGEPDDERPVDDLFNGGDSQTLHDRLQARLPVDLRGSGGSTPAASDQYAELKTRIHHECIVKLGPQLFRADAQPQDIDRPGAPCRRRADGAGPHAACERRAATADPRDRRRHPRLRADRAAAPRRVGHGDHGQRLRQHLRRAWRQDRAGADQVRRRRPPPADHRQDRLDGRPARGRVVADGGRSASRRKPRQRDHPAAGARRAVADHPQVRPRGADDERPDPHGQPDRDGG